ncbi:MULTISPECIES: glutaredoxin domain-containing protein [Clostridium]|uniref:glutaredoxin domain-containing protein n=1 Tax=Clostridium TaxID=1485 RepID=UPI00069CEC6D|nr:MULTISPECIES: glutaredoxin domain-containing protein [Clostridium]KOF56314.1 glutaredoxin [Clostridium sp. DMHC 10]MCD2347909.1 glutathione S-transferase N-terminal domain-containing protein [Clostridium guangxiense]
MVKVYSTPTCPWCSKAKSYLKSKNIDFQDLNVQDDLKAREEMLNLSKQSGVPVINIDGNIIVGFDKPAIDNLLFNK